LSDLENAISNLRKAAGFVDDRTTSTPGILSSLGISQQARFQRLEEFSDLENAIFNLKKAVELTNDGNSQKPTLLSSLGISQQTRFQSLGDLSDLEAAISNMGKAVELTDDRNVNKPNFLASLSNAQQIRFKQVGDTDDAENALLNTENAIELTHDEHPGKPGLLANLGLLQEARFESFGQLSNLENAVSSLQKAVEFTNDEDPNKARFLANLGDVLDTRSNLFDDLPGYMASLACFIAASHSKLADPRVAFYAAKRWAVLSHRIHDIPSALDGYRTALEMLPKIAWLGLDPSSRHDRLRRGHSEDLGCVAATCAIQLGRFEEALELLDLSRSIFWQQASSLRSDLETLREEEPQLAKELESVGRKLDADNFAVTPSVIGGQKMGVGSMEEVTKERRHLVGVWEGLVDEVRKLPKFKYFLRPIPFYQLRQGAPAGQVVIINASEYGVDALIFGATGPIEHVPLPNVNFETLAELSHNIVLQRPANASPAQRQIYTRRFLKPALRIIWNDILIHIFNKIQIPLVDTAEVDRRRIWWYPTGPLTFVPIHAAGPGDGMNDVSRLVVSSYLTTLDALFRGRMSNGSASKRPQKLLGISLPETSGQSSLPQTTKEVETVVKVFRSSGWLEDDIVWLHGSEGTVDRVLEALDTCSWVHFACHGFQHHKLGMKSAFLLQDGHLELGQIASKRLSTGQFAFLSACHAASGLRDLPGEAMHLAAVLQFVGIPSIIATTWDIRDEDAPKVAYATYQYLFRNGLQGLDPSEAATALNHAVLRLREDPDVTVDRWASFVHYGI
jgi:tetratricopeptide (TPR) repeat protein